MVNRIAAYAFTDTNFYTGYRIFYIHDVFPFQNRPKEKKNNRIANVLSIPFLQTQLHYCPGTVKSPLVVPYSWQQ